MSNVDGIIAVLRLQGRMDTIAWAEGNRGKVRAALRARAQPQRAAQDWQRDIAVRRAQLQKSPPHARAGYDEVVRHHVEPYGAFVFRVIAPAGKGRARDYTHFVSPPGSGETYVWSPRQKRFRRKDIPGRLRPQRAAPLDDIIVPAYAPWMDDSPRARSMKASGIFASMPEKMQRIIREAAASAADDVAPEQKSGADRWFYSVSDLNRARDMHSRGQVLRRAAGSTASRDALLLVPSPYGADAVSYITDKVQDYLNDDEGEAWHTPLHANPHEHGSTSDYYGLVPHYADLYMRWLYSLFEDAQVEGNPAHLAWLASRNTRRGLKGKPKGDSWAMMLEEAMRSFSGIVGRAQREEKKYNEKAREVVEHTTKKLSDKVDAVLRVIRSYGKDDRGCWKMAHMAADLREPLESYFNTVGFVAGATDPVDLSDLHYPVEPSDHKGEPHIDNEDYAKWFNALSGRGDALKGGGQIADYYDFKDRTEAFFGRDIAPGLWVIEHYIRPAAAGPRGSILRQMRDALAFAERVGGKRLAIPPEVRPRAARGLFG